MEARTLGQQGLVVSALGYGSMGINLAYGASDEQEGMAAIGRAHDLGVTFFDTADLELTDADLAAIDEAIGGGPYGERNTAGEVWD